jgi:hypothetical protein
MSTIEEFRAAMTLAEKSGKLLFVEAPDGQRHIALGLDSKRGVVICHRGVEIDMSSIRICEP